MTVRTRPLEPDGASVGYLRSTCVRRWASPRLCLGAASAEVNGVVLGGDASMGEPQPVCRGVVLSRPCALGCVDSVFAYCRPAGRGRGMDAHLGISMRLVRPMHLQTGLQASEHGSISPRLLTRPVYPRRLLLLGCSLARLLPLPGPGTGRDFSLRPRRRAWLGRLSLPCSSQGAKPRPGHSLQPCCNLPASPALLACQPPNPPPPGGPRCGALARPRALEPGLAPWRISLRRLRGDPSDTGPVAWALLATQVGGGI